MDLSPKSIESFKLDIIKQINKYRNNHGAKNLINDIKIDKISQKFASKLAKTGKLDYSSNEYKGQILGESVYKSENYLAPLKLARALYDEISEYDFNSKDPEPNNFTQMVWKDSELIGFGMAKSSDNKYFYVINYFPTGNIDGQFKTNVLPEGTKVSVDSGKNKANIKEEIIKEEVDKYEESGKNKSNNKYVIKKVVKEYFDNKDIDFDKEFEDFKNNFDENEKVEVHINKNNMKDKDFNRKNILSELIKIKKKQISKETNTNTNTNINNNKNTRNKNYEITSNSNFNTFCLEALESHNKFRNMHHVPPLKLNKELCSIAENYAKTLATKLQCLQHSGNTYKGQELGENLYGCYGMDPTGLDISNHWYDEIKKYNFNGDWQIGCGHFTQMVWKETEEVGFGKCKDKGGHIYVVANYYPAGNFLGCFKNNVLKK